MGTPFRIPPALPASAYKTYRLDSPRDTVVKAACEYVGCQARANGWETMVDESTALGRAQALYIRTEARRTFTERRTGDGLTVFRFDPGQRCFANHQTRPERYSVTGGDWRGNPLGVPPRIHTRPGDWVEDMQETLDAVRTAQERG